MNENISKIMSEFLNSLVIDGAWKLENADFSEPGKIFVVFAKQGGGKTARLALSANEGGGAGRLTSKHFTIEPLDGGGLMIADRLLRFIEQFEKNNRRLFEEVPSKPPPQQGEMSETAIDERAVVSASGKKKVTVNIILSSRCDWECCFCHVWRLNRNLSDPDERGLLEKIKKLFDGYDRDSVEQINLTGSESFNHKYIFELLEYLTANFGGVTIYTSGMKLLEEDIVERVKTLDGIRFRAPLYGPSAEAHDSVTGVAGSFSRIVAVLEKSPLNIAAHTLILKKNMGFLRETREICVRFGRPHHFEVMHLVPGVEEKYIENAPRLSDIIAEAKNFMSEVEFADFIEVNKRKLPFCIAGEESRLEKTAVSFKRLDGVEVRGFLVQDSQINPDMIGCRFRKECSKGGSCPGVFKVYTRAYGWEEFKPL